MTASSGTRRQVSIWRSTDADALAFEAALDAARVPIALPHRTSWLSRFASTNSLYLGVRDEAGRPVTACGVDVVALRSLPGHALYRVERFGNGLDASSMSLLLRHLAAHARSRNNVLRLVIESFAGDRAALEAFAMVAAELGLTSRVPPHRYTHTLRLNLLGRRDEVFEALPKTARRNLRLAGKAGLSVREIGDAAMAPTLAALEQEAFARTGGEATATDWPALIRYAMEYPTLVRIVGLFASEQGSARDMLGFAVGRSHGDHVEYASAGTTRRPGLKLSLGYPLMWDLIEWAHGLGAGWFDFGGITKGSTNSPGDALGGISDFKRHFGGYEIEVGGEWSLELAQLRGAVADALARVAGMVRKIG